MLIKDATKLQLEPNACSAMSESKIFFMPFSCPPLVTKVDVNQDKSRVQKNFFVQRFYNYRL